MYEGVVSLELQFNNKSCDCLGWVGRETVCRELTQEVRLSDGMPDIGKVLCSWGQMILRGKEWMGDTVTATGGLMVWILYTPDDGSQPRCMDAWIPWQLQWDRMDSQREGLVRISPMLRFLDARTVSARKFMVRAGAAALAEAFCPESHHIFTPVELPEDVQVYRRTYPVRLPKEAGEKTFQIDDELEMADFQPDQLLSFTVHPAATDVRILDSRIVFRGACNLHLVFLCADGKIRTRDFEVPISQYAELENRFGPEARGDVRFAVTNLEASLENQILHLKCAMVAQYLIDDRELVELIEDAYSPQRDTAVKTQILHLPLILENRVDSVTVTGHVSGAVGDVVDICCLTDVPRQHRSTDGVIFDIPGVCHVISYDESGVLQSSVSRWEATSQMNAGEDSCIFGHVISDGSFQSSGTGDGVQLRGKLQLMTETTTGSGMEMVTGLELGDQLRQDSDRPALVLRRPGGQTIWNLAKGYGSTMDAIREANGIQDEPDPGQMLLIPLR